jgi:hypothetical protein
VKMITQVEEMKLESNRRFIELEKPFGPVSRRSSAKTELVHYVRSMPNKTIVQISR